MVLYKRIFFHLSNIYQPNKGRSTLVIEKDYIDVCTEWLGGLKPEKYASRVLQQLGKHFEGLKATRLIRRYEVKTRADGKGLKLVFHPGEGFLKTILNTTLASSRRERKACAKHMLFVTFRSPLSW
jgi:hypothetical protein